MADHKLTNDDIERYSRQLLLPGFEVENQEKLKNSSVLIIGAGGLGCPVAMYLAAAGVGHLGIMDYDDVEINNLHRQIAHSEKTLGISKAKSLESFCKNLNSNIRYSTYQEQLDSKNAMPIVSQYDVICDCSDNAPTRYLINDACVLAKKPLISGSALRWEGQFTVYNYEGGPCYRCLFPTPPPANTVVSCSEGGVLGTIPGIIGNMQALEAIKILAGLGTSFSQRLMLFDGLRGQFRCINLRPRSANCPVCGDNPSVTSLVDYEQFCGSRACDKVISVNKLNGEDRISVQALLEKLANNDPMILLDCRPKQEYKICRISPSFCLPLDQIEKLDEGSLKLEIPDLAYSPEVIVLCHRGNDSQNAVLFLKEKLSKSVVIKDVVGGLEEWSKTIDKNFPRY